MDIASYRDSAQGRAGMVVCTGLSMLQTPPELIDPTRFVTISMNGIYHYQGWRPEHYCVEDSKFLEYNRQHIAEYSHENMTMWIPDKYRAHFYEYRLINDLYPFLDESDSQGVNGFRFSENLSRVVYFGGTVTYLALQILWYVGCRDIYIIGMDGRPNIPEDIHISQHDNIHFTPNYLGGQPEVHPSNQDRILRAYASARDYIETHGGSITNLSAKTYIDVFKRGNYQQVINGGVHARGAIT